MSTMLYGRNTRCVEPPEPCSSNFMPSLSVHTMTVNCRLRRRLEDADRQPGMTKARRVWCHRRDSACEEDNRQDCPLATRQSGFLRAPVGPSEPPGLTCSYRTGRARGLDRSALAIATCGRAVVLYKLIQVNRLRTRTVKLPVVCSGRHSACGQS